MLGWLNIPRRGRLRSREIPEGLWQQTLANFPFLARLEASDSAALRQLTGHFLDTKEFHGAAGLRITDEIAVAIAAQACLPVRSILQRRRSAIR